VGNGRGAHDVLLVVCGSPVFGAPVADAQQQRPPARAHGVRGDEVGVARGVGCGGVGGGSRRGFWFGVAGFFGFGRGRLPPLGPERVLLAA
jgi:hypothetical protein